MCDAIPPVLPRGIIYSITLSLHILYESIPGFATAQWNAARHPWLSYGNGALAADAESMAIA